MPIRQDPWAQGIGNLGTALFGSPRDDVAISQAQNLQASRQKTLGEIQRERQAQQALQGLGDILAGTDMQDPAAMEAMRQAIPLAIQGGMEPADLAEFARFGIGTGGGTFEQFTGAVTDPTARLKIEEANRARADMDQRLGALMTEYPELGNFAQQYGPDIGEWPNFAQQTAAAHIEQGIPVPQVLPGMTGQLENVPVGESIYQINSLNPGQSINLVDPRDPYRANMGMAPLGAVSGRQVSPQASGAPAPAPAAPAPQVQPGAGAGPQPPASQSQGGGQEPIVAPERIRPVGETGVFGETTIDTPAGGIKQLVDADGRPVPLMEIIEYGSGFGASAQRLLNNTLGQASDRFFFEVPEIAQAQIAGLAADLRPLLTVSNRPSRWELEQIEKVLADPGAWRNPETNAARLRNLRADIEAGMVDAQQKLATQPMSSQDRQQLTDAVSHASGLLRKIGEPRRVSGADANLNRLGEIMDAFTRRGGGRELRDFGGRVRDTVSGGQQLQPEPATEYTEEDLEILRQFAPQQESKGSGGGGRRMFDTQN